MNSVFVMRGVALTAVLFAAAETRAVGTVALDNTAAGTATLAGNLGSLSTTNWNFKVFTVGASNATISSMTMGMYSSSQTTYNTTWELYAVDGSNNPTGAVLASDTQSQSLPGGGGPSSAYYDFTTGGTLASYSMQAGQTYGLLFKTDATGTSVSWTAVTPATVYTPGSSGFNYVANRRTTNSGSSYSDNTYYNAWSMTVNASAVPGTGLAAIGSLGLASVARRRRRH